jgi:hypothetical protein
VLAPSALAAAANLLESFTGTPASRTAADADELRVFFGLGGIGIDGAGCGSAPGGQQVPASRAMAGGGGANESSALMTRASGARNKRLVMINSLGHSGCLVEPTQTPGVQLCVTCENRWKFE